MNDIEQAVESLNNGMQYGSFITDKAFKIAISELEKQIPKSRIDKGSFLATYGTVYKCPDCGYEMIGMHNFCGGCGRALKK